MILLLGDVCLRMRNSALLILSGTRAFFCCFNNFNQKRVFFSSKTVWSTWFWCCLHQGFNWPVTAWLKLTTGSSLSAGLKLRALCVPGGIQGGDQGQHLQGCSKTFLWYIHTVISSFKTLGHYCTYGLSKEKAKRKMEWNV